MGSAVQLRAQAAGYQFYMQLYVYIVCIDAEREGGREEEGKNKPQMEGEYWKKINQHIKMGL